MRVQDDRWFIASRDLYHATCHHCIMLSMAVAAKSPWAIEKTKDFKPNFEVIQILQGNDYEKLRFEQIKNSLKPGQFVEIEGKANKLDTMAALEAKVPVIAQAYLEVEYLHVTLTGYADLLVREDYELVFIDDQLCAKKLAGTPDSDKYVPYDIKYTSTPKSFYWHQVSAYHEALQILNIASERDLGIITKTQILNQNLQDSLTEFEKARYPLFYQLETHKPSTASTWSNLALSCETPTACKDIYCEYPDLCKQDRIDRDTFYQMYENAKTASAKLRQAGIDTVTKLSKLTKADHVDGIEDSKLENLVIEAQLVINEKHKLEPRVLKKPTASKTIPAPSPGDLYTDFEWFTPLMSSEYLYYVLGAVNAKSDFSAFQADSYETERHAFAAYVDLCLTMIHHHPDMHIYHWSPPEFNGLTNLARRHNLYHDETMIIQKHMIDLNPIAKDRLWVGVASYGIKDLERYYAKQNPNSQVNRDTDTDGGAASQVQYYRYLEAQAQGKADEAQAILRDIIEYNKADCVSTLEVCNWLRSFD